MLRQEGTEILPVLGNQVWHNLNPPRLSQKDQMSLSIFYGNQLRLHTTSEEKCRNKTKHLISRHRTQTPNNHINNRLLRYLVKEIILKWIGEHDAPGAITQQRI